MYLPKKSDWSILKSEYFEYLTTLTNKHGPPNDSYNYFESPYKEGEGDEMQGVEMEKCNYVAFWKNIALYISRFKQIKISYENNINIELRDSEKARQKMEIF